MEKIAMIQDQFLHVKFLYEKTINIYNTSEKAETLHC